MIANEPIPKEDWLRTLNRSKWRITSGIDLFSDRSMNRYVEYISVYERLDREGRLMSFGDHDLYEVAKMRLMEGQR